MNWFKKLFGIGDKRQTGINEIPVVRNLVPIPKVNFIKVGKDLEIGEPVIAIAKSIQDNPTHWKLLADPWKQSVDGFGFEWILKDIKRDRYFQCYEFVRYNRDSPSGHREEYLYHSVEKWATKDEVEYIVAEVKNMMQKREERLERYKKYRLNKPRKILMEIYCAKES